MSDWIGEFKKTEFDEKNITTEVKLQQSLTINRGVYKESVHKNLKILDWISNRIVRYQIGKSMEKAASSVPATSIGNKNDSELRAVENLVHTGIVILLWFWSFGLE